MTKAERGRLFEVGGTHDATASKDKHCSFSNYRVILFDLLKEKMGDDGRVAFRQYPLLDLGIDYDDNLTVEETFEKIKAHFEQPKVTVHLKK